MMAVGSILSAAAAIAAEDQASTSRVSSGIEQVIVTATRREETLQDVPLAVSAVTAEALEARNITNLADLSAGSIPSVVFTQFSGGSGTLAISVRGVGLSDPTQGTTELTVPVYIDGIFLGRAQGLGLDLIEAERVEILRGPQGQLFGRNAEGGVVQYVSRKPSGEFDLKGSVSYGDFDDQRYKLSIDLPKVGGFSAQVSGLYHKHDPYTEMSGVSRYPGGAAAPGPNHGHLELDTKGYRGAVRWQNEGGGFTADYSYDDSDSFQTEGYLTWVDVDVVRPPFSLQAPGEDYLDTTNQQLVNPGFDIKTSGHNLTLAWDVSDAVTLKSLSAYRKASRHGANNLGAALVGGGSSTGLVYTMSREDIDQDQTSQEFQFIGSWSQFNLTAGAIYFTEDIVDERTSNVNGPGLTPPALGLAPGLVFFGCVGRDPCPTTNTVSEAETESYGVYAQGSWRPAALDDKLELTVGVRYTDDKKEATRVFNNVGPFPVDADFSTSRVDPAATIKYQWTDSLQTYLRYATGYRAGGANVRSSQFTSFDEEENEAWELGLKSQLGERVQLNLALFQTTVKGEQLNIQEQPTTNPSLTDTVNATNDKEVRGVEAELFVAATSDLDMGLSFSYMDRDDSVELDNPFTAPTDITRFYTVSTPETSGSVFLDYNHELGLGSFGFHADYAYARDYWTTPGALQLVTLLPTYVRPESETNQLGARLSWGDIDVGGGQLTLALWGRNLTDDSSIAYGFDGCASGGGHCAFRVAPRTYGVELKFDF
jgi:iron complex outermembrane receptor protein